jgi:hypothetical protein
VKQNEKQQGDKTMNDTAKYIADMVAYLGATKTYGKDEYKFFVVKGHKTYSTNALGLLVLNDAVRSNRVEGFGAWLYSGADYIQEA